VNFAIGFFFALQALDVATTLLGFRLGAAEVSPFIRALIHTSSPLVGLVACKLIAFAVAGIAIASKRPRVIKLANMGYSALVVWNVAIIATLAMGGRA